MNGAKQLAAEACCAHRNVIYERVNHEGGTCSDLWKCADCGHKFIPESWRNAAIEKATEDTNRKLVVVYEGANGNRGRCETCDSIAGMLHLSATTRATHDSGDRWSVGCPQEIKEALAAQAREDYKEHQLRGLSKLADAAHASEPDILQRLQYIADSPPSDDGGFHEQAIQTAKDVLEYINLHASNEKK